MLFWLSENDGLCCFCGLGNWKQTSQSGHYCYSGLLIIAQRVSRKCLANDPFLVWYPHNKLHLHIIYKVCLIYSVSNQFAFLSHYRYVFVTPCVSWVVSSSVSFCRKQRSKVPQWILKIIFSSKSCIEGFVFNRKVFLTRIQELQLQQVVSKYYDCFMTKALTK